MTGRNKRMKHLSVLLSFLCLSVVGYSQITGGIGVIPAPQHVRMTGGRFGTRTVLYNYDPFSAVGDTAVKGGEGCVLTDLCLDSSGRRLKKSGYIEVPADGVYCFFLPARDRGELFRRPGHLQGWDCFSGIEQIGAAPLKKGLHTVRLNYSYDGGKMIPLDYQGADGKRHRFTASQPDR